MGKFTWSMLLPGGLLSWRDRRQALRELSMLSRLEALVLPLDEGNPVNRAKMALEAGDKTAAAHFWEQALRRYPHFAKSSHDSIAILLDLRRFDEAEALMLDGQKNWRRDAFYAEGSALVAERRGDLQAAIQRWEQARTKFPGSPTGYVRGSLCLRRTGLLEAAETLSKDALRRFPENLLAWLEWARIAEDRSDWTMALHRWEEVGKKFRHALVDMGAALALEEMGRFDDAEKRLRGAQSHFPLESQIVFALARLAHRRGENGEAVQRWAEAMRRFPLLSHGYLAGFRHLVEIGHDADAEKVLLAAMDRFPVEIWPKVEYASLASKRKDWTAAAERWATVRKEWPNRQDGYLMAAAALTALGRQDEAEALRGAHRQQVVTGSQTP